MCCGNQAPSQPGGLHYGQAHWFHRDDRAAGIALSSPEGCLDKVRNGGGRACAARSTLGVGRARVFDLPPPSRGCRIPTPDGVAILLEHGSHGGALPPAPVRFAPATRPLRIHLSSLWEVLL